MANQSVHAHMHTRTHARTYRNIQVKNYKKIRVDSMH